MAVDANKLCTKCGRLGSNLNKTTDALVVAHAAILEKRKSVATLYTLDGGPIHLATGLPKRGYALNVTRPPNPSGPLFALLPPPQPPVLPPAPAPPPPAATPAPATPAPGTTVKK